MMTLLMMLTMVASLSAMSYSKARTHALFLTDKMGYELNLTDDQYDAVYEINLDYFMSIRTQSDLYGVYWSRRDFELQYVLSAYQYQRYHDSEYFYRPITWSTGSFTFSIYTRYVKNRYFRNAPRVFDSYRGGNRQYQYSPYQGRIYSGEPNRGVDHKPAHPDKTKSEAIKGGRQHQQNNSGTWRQTQPGGNNNAKPQNNGGNSGNKESQRGSFGGSRR